MLEYNQLSKGTNPFSPSLAHSALTLPPSPFLISVSTIWTVLLEAEVVLEFLVALVVVVTFVVGSVVVAFVVAAVLMDVVVTAIVAVVLVTEAAEVVAFAAGVDVVVVVVVGST